MILYRIEYIHLFEDDTKFDSLLSGPVYRLQLLKLEVIKETPSGYWIKPYNSNWIKKKWVSKSGRKRYPYDTIQGVRTNFIKRNKKRLSILKNQIEVVEKSLELVKTFYKPKTKLKL